MSRLTPFSESLKECSSEKKALGDDNLKSTGPGGPQNQNCSKYPVSTLSTLHLLLGFVQCKNHGRSSGVGAIQLPCKTEASETLGRGGF